MPRLMFQRPRRIEWEELTPQFGRMIAEPFEKGYALTVGNALRRVLLSALPGAAPTWVKIGGLSKDGTRLTGIEEDVTTLLLNLKRIVVRLHAEEPVTAKLDVKGPKGVTAADLRSADLEILDSGVALATVEAGARLALEVGIASGRGYVSADSHTVRPPSGAIALDAAFSPIRRVNYTVEMSRLGKITDYEKLVVEIATNGTIAPDQALLRASGLLRDHFDLFTPAGAEEEEDEESAVEPARTTRPS